MNDKMRAWPTWIGKATQRKKLNDIKPPKAHKGTQCESSDAYLRLILLEKLPKYSQPSDENFDSFLYIFQQYLEILHVKENEKVSLLFACLRENALDKLTHQPITINDQTSWEQTTQKLRDIFCSNNTLTIQTLQQLKQQDHQPLENFAHTVQQLVNNLFLNSNGYTDQQRENESIRYFVRGIVKPVKNQLKGNKFQSMKEVLAKAQQIQTTMIINDR